MSIPYPEPKITIDEFMEAFLKSQFGDEYSKYYVQRSKRLHKDSLRSDLLRLEGSLPLSVYEDASLACPYCFNNPNYEICGQCMGRGRISHFNFDRNGKFLGIGRL
jgi:hypothetical protein